MVSNIELVVLDTSHLSRLATDWASSDYVRKRSAEQFVPRLLDHGWLPLLSWHQIEELLQHGDESLVDTRLRYLWSWPMTAWVTSEKPNVFPGSVLNVFTAEVCAAYSHPELDALGVRDVASTELLAYGTGIEAVPSSLSDWRLLRPMLAEQQAHAQKVAAISPWRAADIDRTRLADWLDKPLRSTETIDQRLSDLRTRLEREIATRGDKRIQSATDVADDFMAEVTANGCPVAADDSTVPPAMRILLNAGLEPDDVNPSATFRETMDLLMFRQRLKMASDSANLPWSKVKQVVTRDRLPSAIVTECMRTYGHDQPERKGSDVNDVSLLCLAPYASHTFVDKRTLESVRRAKQKASHLGGILGDVRKAAGYREIMALLPPR